MNFQNIFGKPTSVGTTSRLRRESDDFDFSHTMMEHALYMEDVYLNVTQEHAIATHLALKEDNPDILREGFRDFTYGAVKFFKTLIEKFSAFMDRVLLILKANLGDFSKFLQNNRDVLNSLNPDFTVEGYEYTLSSNVPKIDRIEHIVSSYNSEISDVKKMTKEEVLRQREEYTSAQKLEDIRAYVLQTHGRPIPSDEFEATARNVFRNDSDEPMEIRVDAKKLKEVINGYAELNTQYKECARQRTKTITLIESMKTFFQKSAAVHYDEGKKVMYAHHVTVNSQGSGLNRTDIEKAAYSNETADVLNTYYNFKWQQTKELGSISITALTEKVTALKEAIRLSQRIVRRAVMQGNSGSETGGDN